MRLRTRVREELKARLSTSAYLRMMRFWEQPQYEVERRRAAAARRARGAPRLIVGFAPDFPTPHHVITRMCAQLGVRRTTRRMGAADLVIAWSDTTTWDPSHPRLPSDAANRACTDISKSRVNKVFEEVFGYAIGVDPMSHVGPAVEKSERNAQHDGRAVDCPTTPRPGSTYQRLIDNLTDDGTAVLDFRVPIVGGRVPLLYERRRTAERRFRSGNEHSRIVDIDQHLSTDEVARIERFASAMGLDLGEMDVLRDRHDGRLYVVDVNNTPWGPPSGMDEEEGRRAVEILADAFEAWVVHRNRT